MASINIKTFLLSHSCAFSPLTAKMRRGEEKRGTTGNRKTEGTIINNCLSLPSVVHKVNTKVCMCVLQNDGKRLTVK